TLTRGAVIAGTIRYDNNVPVPSAQVSLLRSVIGDGERKLQSASPSWEVTDDRGRYRMYGLLPGEYTVMVRGGGEVGMTARLVSAADIDAAQRELRGMAASPASVAQPV